MLRCSATTTALIFHKHHILFILNSRNLPGWARPARRSLHATLPLPYVRLQLPQLLHQLDALLIQLLLLRLLRCRLRLLQLLRYLRLLLQGLNQALCRCFALRHSCRRPTLQAMQDTCTHSVVPCGCRLHATLS